MLSVCLFIILFICFIILVLFNRSKRDFDIVFDKKDVNIKGDMYGVRDVWMHMDVGIITDVWAAKVVSHSVKMYKLTPVMTKHTKSIAYEKVNLLNKRMRV